MKDLKRQDRNGSRKASDIEQKYRLGRIDYTEEEIEEMKKQILVDSSLSASSSNAVANSVITAALNTKVTKETGKELSSNDFTDADKAKVHSHANKDILDSVTQDMLTNWEMATLTSHAHSNKSVLDKITQDIIDDSHTHTNKAVLDKITQSIIDNSHTHTNKVVLDKITQTMLNNWNNTATKTTYDLSAYKVSGLTILRSSCIKKNKRVVINFVGTIALAANTTTTLFDLPDDVSPLGTKDFVVFGQTNNDDGHIGYGYITETGSLQVRFGTAISSYIRFSVTYDLD